MITVTPANKGLYLNVWYKVTVSSMIVEYLSSTTKNTHLNPKIVAKKSENTKDHENRRIENMIVLYGDVGMYSYCTEWSPGYDGTGRTIITRNIYLSKSGKNKKIWFSRNTSLWLLKFTEWSQIIMSHVKFIA